MLRQIAALQRRKRGPKGHTTREALAMYYFVAERMRERRLTAHAAVLTLGGHRIEVLPGHVVAVGAQRWRRVYDEVRRALALADARATAQIERGAI